MCDTLFRCSIDPNTGNILKEWYRCDTCKSLVISSNTKIIVVSNDVTDTKIYIYRCNKCDKAIKEKKK